MYLTQQFGRELKDVLDKKFAIIKIARWTDHFYATHIREISEELNKVIMALSCMQHGPEFEYTESELRLLADMLIENEKDPIKKLAEMK
ncbi:MAG: hypothetical protein BGO14_10155 [Chlamydiales bacterium 38-26]|nr:hypothetical protein [Chlamydiales bacterium]OJV11326.1 MAG: hypothetical protein BGO14_10155 [Chlamydiales bacterium 38-26]